MINTDEIFMDYLEKLDQEKAKELGIDLETFMYMTEKEKEEERLAIEQDLENKYWDHQADINSLKNF